MNLCFLSLAFSWLEALAVRLYDAKGPSWSGTYGRQSLNYKLHEMRTYSVHSCIPDIPKKSRTHVKYQWNDYLNEYSGLLGKFSYLSYPTALSLGQWLLTWGNFVLTRGDLAISRGILILEKLSLPPSGKKPRVLLSIAQSEDSLVQPRFI